MRIGFEKAAAFFWDVKSLERIRSNTSKEHIKRDFAVLGGSFEIEANIKEAVVQGGLLGMTKYFVKSMFSTKMRLLRIDVMTIIIFTEPNEIDRASFRGSFWGG